MNILSNNHSKIEFTTYFDNMNKLDMLISKYQSKFSKANVGISYTKEPILISSVDLLKITINIDLPTISHEGWNHVATVEKVAITDENEKFTGYNTIVYSKIAENNYSNIEFKCDHCNTKHNRLTVHVFKKENEEKIIGTACAKEYFGINVYKDIVTLLNLFPKINDLAEECEGISFGGSRKIISNKEQIIKLAYSIINLDKGYKSKQYDEINSTACKIDSFLNDCNTKEPKKLEFVKTVNEELNKIKERDLVSEVREYWFSKNEENDFIHNVQTSLKMIEPKIGLLAYAVWEYMREVEDFTGKNAFNKKIITSNYIGTVGEKIKNKEIEIYNISSFESIYGITFIVSMIDADNNVIVWKTSALNNINKGDKLTIKTSIIKDHNEYKNVKQTIVKNVKFI